MKLTKSVLFIALAGITLNSNFAAAGGIPVIDGAHISTNVQNQVQSNLCEGEIILDVVKQKQNENRLKVVKQRISKIQSISKRMATATDTKEAQDLSNAMQTQIALLQADKIQADLEQNADELNQRMIEKKKQDEIRRVKYILPN